VPRWDNAPHAHSRVLNNLYRAPHQTFFSNISVDIWHPAVGLRCIIPPRHLSQLRTRAIPLTYPKVGGIMHLKPTAGCQISTLIFEKKLWRGGLSINILWKIQYTYIITFWIWKIKWWKTYNNKHLNEHKWFFFCFNCLYKVHISDTNWFILVIQTGSY
jgi:hypothetical protein